MFLSASYSTLVNFNGVQNARNKAFETLLLQCFRGFLFFMTNARKCIKMQLFAGKLIGHMLGEKLLSIKLITASFYKKDSLEYSNHLIAFGK